jgi:hypothetical protein
VTESDGVTDDLSLESMEVMRVTWQFYGPDLARLKLGRQNHGGLCAAQTP